MVSQRSDLSQSEGWNLEVDELVVGDRPEESRLST